MRDCLTFFWSVNPAESPVGNITDKWFENRTMDFAKDVWLE